MRHHALPLLTLLMGAAGLMFGQTGAGMLTGVVTDSTGAGVVSRTFRQSPPTSTPNTKIIGTTTDTGNYTIPQLLPVGQYVITASVQQGFREHSAGRMSPSLACADSPGRCGSGTGRGIGIGDRHGGKHAASISTLPERWVKTSRSRRFRILPVLAVTSFCSGSTSAALTLVGSVSGGAGFGVPRMNGVSLTPITNIKSMASSGT